VPLGRATAGVGREARPGFVSTLRRLLGEGRIETHAPGYALRVDAGELDVDRVEALLGEARTAAPARAAAPAARAASSLRAPSRAWPRRSASPSRAQNSAARSATAYANFQLAGIAVERGEQSAAELLGEAARSFAAAGDEHFVLMASYNLAVFLGRQGHHQRSRRLHHDSLRRSRAAGVASVEAWSLQELAAYARADGRTEEALTMLRAALLIERGRGDHIDITECLSEVARTLPN
jgi:hypothetical protein